MKLDREEMSAGRCCGTCAWWAKSERNSTEAWCQAFPRPGQLEYPRTDLYWCCRFHETREEQEFRDPHNRSKP